MRQARAIASFLALVFLGVEAVQGSQVDCSNGTEILIDAKEMHSGTITSPGYPKQIVSSFCKYKIQTSSSSKVYVEFTDFDLPRCQDGFVELLSRQMDEDETEVCLGKKDTDTKLCEFCNKAKPVPSHSKSSVVTLMIKFNLNSAQYKGFKMLWRSGSYGNFYNWVSDPVNNRKELAVGIVLGILGFIGLIAVPALLYWYLRRRGRGGDQVLVPQRDAEDEEDEEEGSY